jgi:hypothetical protein
VRRDGRKISRGNEATVDGMRRKERSVEGSREEAPVEGMMEGSREQGAPVEGTVGRGLRRQSKEWARGNRSRGNEATVEGMRRKENKSRESRE